MNFLLRWIKRRRCRHEHLDFVRNIYGDEINQVSLSTVYRSWWKCKGCNRYIPKQELVSKEQQEEIIWRRNNFDKPVNQ